MIIVENGRHELRTPAARLTEALGRAATTREYASIFAEYLELQPCRGRMRRMGPDFRHTPAHLRARLLGAAPKTYDRLARASGCWS